MNFVDPWNESAGRHPAERQSHVASSLPKRASELGVPVWHPRDPIRATGRRILVGVSEWTRGDLEILDRLVEARRSELEIFLLHGLKMEDFEEFIPGLGRVFHAPLGGVWEDGVLVEKGSGFEARSILEKYCDR